MREGAEITVSVTERFVGTGTCLLFYKILLETWLQWLQTLFRREGENVSRKERSSPLPNAFTSFHLSTLILSLRFTTSISGLERRWRKKRNQNIEKEIQWRTLFSLLSNQTTMQNKYRNIEYLWYLLSILFPHYGLLF